MTLSGNEAREIAERFLDERVRGNIAFPVIIIESAVEETDNAWIFPYDGKAYVEDDDLGQLIAGNLPVVVDKATSSADFIKR